MRCWCAGSSAAPPTPNSWSSCSAAIAGWRSSWRRHNMVAPSHLDRPSSTPSGAGPAEYPHDALWDALREVEDPELGISVVDMGLIVDACRDGPNGHDGSTA